MPGVVAVFVPLDAGGGVGLKRYAAARAEGGRTQRRDDRLVRRRIRDVERIGHRTGAAADRDLDGVVSDLDDVVGLVRGPADREAVLEPLVAGGAARGERGEAEGAEEVGARDGRFGRNRVFRDGGDGGGCAAAGAVGYGHRVVPRQGGVVCLTGGPANRAVVEVPLVAGGAIRSQQRAAAGAEGIAAADRRRGRKRIDCHGRRGRGGARTTARGHDDVVVAVAGGDVRLVRLTSKE